MYTSLDFSTSEHYSNAHNDSRQWGNSELGLRRVLSINEIVFDQSRFVSTSPHIVVPYDMLKTRFLVIDHERRMEENVPSVVDRSTHAMQVDPTQAASYIVHKQNFAITRGGETLHIPFIEEVCFDSLI